MAWDFWDKRKNYRSSNNRIQKEYRSPFTGALETSRLGEENARREFDNKSCRGSGDCGSGYSCIDGQCVKIYTRNGGNYKPATCGDENVTWAPCKKGNNTGGAKDKCGRPTPGNCEKDPICPGQKCCRQQGDGSIRCVCGPCSQTDTSRCNVWCDANYKNYGDIGAGCFTSDMDGFGECGGNICDECEFCENDFFGAGGVCTKGSQDDPFNPLACHCFDSCAGDCEICDKDPGSSTFGECVEDKTNCQQCCTQYNYTCPQCPKVITSATHCQSASSPKPCITALREKLYKQCENECATEPDPCAPTGSGSNCVPGNVGGSVPQFTCPEGKTCDYTGYIEVGGENPQTCFLYNTWVTADIPAECEQCDCNCHNDCKECELCNAQGKCESDPACEVTAYTMKLWSTETGHYYGYSGPPTIINCGTLDSTPTLVKTYPNIAPENVANFTIKTETTPYTDTVQEVCCDCLEREDANDSCLGTCPCPGTVTIKYPYINDVVVPYVAKYASGCIISRPQGGITTWLITSGDLWWEAVPQI